MASVVRMPSVLAGATEAAIANWLVAPGDTVQVGDPIAEIETEKALVEYSAEQAGVVGRIVLAAGDTGEIGAPIAVLVREGETDADIDAALGGGNVGGPGSGPGDGSGGAAGDGPGGAVGGARGGAVADGGAGEDVAGRVAGHSDGVAAAKPAARTRVFASPIVRKIAGEKGIDLATVAGTGPNGRIVRRDLERLTGLGRAEAAGGSAEAGTAEEAGARVEAGTPEAAGAPTGAEASKGVEARAGADGAKVSAGAGVPPGDTLIPHTPLRLAIARRLTESKTTTPHFYMAAECVVDELLALRARINETAPTKISVNDFVIMAVAAAFRDVPEANVTWSEAGLIAHSSVDLSIAVATDGGLVTPVLRGVETMRLSEIAARAQALAGRARDRRLHQHELEGGVFSISNLGMYGTLEFSAIINPPQSGILAVGAATPQPVVADGSVTVATVMRCTLSVDHRAIDGALAARWLAAFTARMRDPLGTII